MASSPIRAQYWILIIYKSISDWSNNRNPSIEIFILYIIGLPPSSKWTNYGQYFPMYEKILFDIYGLSINFNVSFIKMYFFINIK